MNHRLATLVGLLGIKIDQAHRALDDSKACLEVSLKCMEQLGANATLEFIFQAQGGPFQWKRYSMEDLMKTEIGKALVEGSRKQMVLEIVYTGEALQEFLEG